MVRQADIVPYLRGIKSYLAQRAIEMERGTEGLIENQKYIDELIDAITNGQGSMRKGRWIDEPYVPSHTMYTCSECYEHVYTNSEAIKKHHFCYQCGADMRDENGLTKIVELC